MENKPSLPIIVKLAVLILILILIALGFSILKVSEYKRSVNVITDKTEYSNEDVLKVKIENGLKEKICFSSCYSYYFEKKNTGWESYNYPECLTENLSKECVDSKKVKAFEIKLPPLEKGTHRLAIPVCSECNVQEKFREDKWLYSNEFIINE